MSTTAHSTHVSRRTGAPANNARIHAATIKSIRRTGAQPGVNIAPTTSATTDVRKNKQRRVRDVRRTEGISHRLAPGAFAE